MAKGSFVVLGSGPGIGVSTATLFATKKFTSVALLARNAQRLESDASAVLEKNPFAIAKTYSVDISDAAALKSTLERVAEDVGPPEVVLFNAARIEPSTIGEEPPETVLNDFKVMSLGMYVAMSWAQPYLVEMAKDAEARPCFFLSGGVLYRNPLAELFSLGLNKAAQINLMMSFSKVVGPKGVHVANVNVCGRVKDEEPVMNATNISKMFWELYEEKKEDWRFQIECGEAPEFSLEK